ncbi:MAG: phosphoribosylglycinamide formyltransferase [Flavobacteriales bacterium]|nr:phosphoribosylglycinamide formyltransferase [Flavobacteriales bacterium]
MTKQRLSIFISGKGSNAINLIHYFKKSSEVEIAAVLSTKENESVESLCKTEGINYESFAQKPIETLELINFCDKNKTDWIILAGFLKKIPVELVQKFPNKIVNLHPSLLPKFGGKGMYGMHVHKAVLEAKEQKSGISIHFVNEEFDKGKIIAQFETDLSPNETPESLAAKIHELEMNYFPEVLKQLLITKK